MFLQGKALQSSLILLLCCPVAVESTVCSLLLGCQIEYPPTHCRGDYKERKEIREGISRVVILIMVLFYNGVFLGIHLQSTVCKLLQHFHVLPSCWRSQQGPPPWDTILIFFNFLFFCGCFKTSRDLPLFSARTLEAGLDLFVGLNFLLFTIIDYCVVICAREVRKNELWKQRSIYFYFLILFCALGITGCLWYFLGEYSNVHSLFTGWYWAYGNSYHVFNVIID